MRSVSSPRGRHRVLPEGALQVGAPEGAAETHGHPRASPFLARIRDPHRHDREPQTPLRPVLRLQRDAGGPGAKLRQLRLGVDSSPRVDLDRATRVQNGHRVTEHVLVAVHGRGVVLSPVHRGCLRAPGAPGPEAAGRREGPAPAGAACARCNGRARTGSRRLFGVVGGDQQRPRGQRGAAAVHPVEDARGGSHRADDQLRDPARRSGQLALLLLRFSCPERLSSPFLRLNSPRTNPRERQAGFPPGTANLATLHSIA